VDFAVAGGLAPVAIENDRRVVGAVLARHAFEETAAMHPDAVIARERAHHLIGGPSRRRLGDRELFRARTAHPIEDFRKQHPIGALLRHRALDQLLRLREVCRLVADGIHLDERDFHKEPPRSSFLQIYRNIRRGREALPFVADS
jgi:hypothetical protein